MLAHAHGNTVVVALAGKMARIAWALLGRGQVYSIAPAA